MKTFLRSLLASIVGLILALVLVVAIEYMSSIAHPPPPGFSNTEAEICDLVSTYPHSVLGIVVIAWAATAFLSTWSATKIGGRIPGAVVALLLLLALGSNLSMLPYTNWFKVVMPIGLGLACYLGVNLGQRMKLKPLTTGMA
jgi:hypothetical protein